MEVKGNLNMTRREMDLKIDPHQTVSKVKRQPSEWEKIIANETTDKELISFSITDVDTQYQKH